MKPRLLLAFLILALALGGCGGDGGSSGQKEPEIIPAELAASILEQVDFKASLVPIAPEAVENWYFLNDYVSDYAIYINGDVVPAEELAVLKTENAADVAELEKILDQRLENLLVSFENYQPAELGKIKNPVRAAKGGVVVMALTDDPNAGDKVSELLK